MILVSKKMKNNQRGGIVSLACIGRVFIDDARMAWKMLFQLHRCMLTALTVQTWVIAHVLCEIDTAQLPQRLVQRAGSLRCAVCSGVLAMAKRSAFTKLCFCCSFHAIPVLLFLRNDLSKISGQLAYAKTLGFLVSLVEVKKSGETQFSDKVCKQIFIPKGKDP